MYWKSIKLTFPKFYFCPYESKSGIYTKSLIVRVRGHKIIWSFQLYWTKKCRWCAEKVMKHHHSHLSNTSGRDVSYPPLLFMYKYMWHKSSHPNDLFIFIDFLPRVSLSLLYRILISCLRIRKCRMSWRKVSRWICSWCFDFQLPKNLGGQKAEAPETRVSSLLWNNFLNRISNNIYLCICITVSLLSCTTGAQMLFLVSWSLCYIRTSMLNNVNKDTDDEDEDEDDATVVCELSCIFYLVRKITHISPHTWMS